MKQYSSLLQYSFWGKKIKKKKPTKKPPQKPLQKSTNPPISPAILCYFAIKAKFSYYLWISDQHFPKASRCKKNSSLHLTKSPFIVYPSATATITLSSLQGIKVILSFGFLLLSKRTITRLQVSFLLYNTYTKTGHTMWARFVPVIHREHFISEHKIQKPPQY